MGRPPIGDKAMTAAERQRKRRERLAGEHPWEPVWKRPGEGEVSRRHAYHNHFVERLHDWLEYGDMDRVAKFLADIGRWPELSALAASKAAEADAEAIEDERLHMEWVRNHRDEADPMDLVRLAGHDAERDEPMSQINAKRDANASQNTAAAEELNPQITDIPPALSCDARKEITELLMPYSGQSDDPAILRLGVLFEDARKAIYASAGPKPTNATRAAAWKRKRGRAWHDFAVSFQRLPNGHAIIMSARVADRFIERAHR